MLIWSTGGSDYTIKCGDLHDPVLIAPPQLLGQRPWWWATGTPTEVMYGLGVQEFGVRCWIYDDQFTDANDGTTGLRDYIRTLRNLIGSHGTLYEKLSDASHWDTRQNVTLEGLDELQLAPRTGPHNDPNSLGGSWMMHIELRFTQLRDQSGSPPSPP